VTNPDPNQIDSRKFNHLDRLKEMMFEEISNIYT